MADGVAAGLPLAAHHHPQSGRVHRRPSALPPAARTVLAPGPTSWRQAGGSHLRLARTARGVSAHGPTRRPVLLDLANGPARLCLHLVVRWLPAPARGVWRGVDRQLVGAPSSGLGPCALPGPGHRAGNRDSPLLSEEHDLLVSARA